jgi:hypothetical protein
LIVTISLEKTWLWDCDNNNRAIFGSGLTLNGTGAVPLL